ncbi:TetR/AcrR family transcriptional regulator [Nonomuraea soli]|uniref:AcrR family transcriptional regulator n=1 Tax=Nonomuraea soli TaxID=1032476 RepID=A0A7W0CR32_9ACTN|nr:TetR/AcrR family transcriptional regulator [Nonomuraea soli]MBA2895752.1 AcrR family transcriptional regulator [Nonomuraea soli]
MTTIREPQNARSRRTREALLNAARRLIEEEGFEATTMAAVAERAGVSTRALYLHFSSRGDLLTTLYRHLGATEDIQASLDRVWNSPDAVSAVEEWAHHLARVHPRIMAVSRAVQAACRTDPDAAAMHEAAMRGWHLGSTRLMTWLADEGALAPPWTAGSAADMLWGLMSWDLLERLTVDKGWPAEKYGTHMAELFLATFVRKAAPRTSSR